MKKNLIKAAMVLSGGLLASPVFAAGFELGTQNARATAMGTAVGANVSDASAIFYNPGGLAQGKGLDLQIGDSLIAPSFTYTPVGGGTSVSSNTGIVPPFQLYAAYGISDDLTVGLGIYNEFGLGVSWPTPWPGQDYITKSSLTTYNINPTFAFKLTDWARAGVGIMVVRGVVDIQRDLNLFSDTPGGIEIGGGAWGVGADVGFQIDILPKKLLSFGANYRSRVDLPFSGQAHFSNVPTDLQTTLEDQNIKADFLLPDTVRLGLGTMPMAGLTIDFDAIYTAWQTFNSLDVTFDNPQLNIAQPKLWDYTWNAQLGAEYYVTPSIPVRIGFVYDPSPASANATTLATLSPDLPDSSRFNVAVGAGYRWKGLYADLGFQYVTFFGATSTYPPFTGKYGGAAEVLGLTIGYRMGQDSPAAKPADTTPAPTPAPAPAPVESTPTPSATPAPASSTPAPSAAPAATPAPAPAPAASTPAPAAGQGK